jgi:hypothetical protein
MPDCLTSGQFWKSKNEDVGISQIPGEGTESGTKNYYYLEQEVACAVLHLPAPLRGCGSAGPGQPVLQPGPGDAVPGQPVHLPGCGSAGCQLIPPRLRSGSGNHSACASLAYF